MSKFDEERLYKLRRNLKVELPEVVIFTDFDRTYIHIVYIGKSICKIRTNGSGYDVTYTSEFGINGHEYTQWFSGYRSISGSIRNAISNYEKGQNNMMTLGDLRDYIQKELGNLVAAVYIPEKPGPGPSGNHIRIKHGSCWVCSIYRGKSDNERHNDIFNVIFYDPFTCKSAGYSSSSNFTVSDIPRAIKNRINICNGVNDNKIAVDYCKNNVDITKEIYMMSARGNGKTRYVSELLKNKTVVYNGNMHTNIENVIFNDPATIVFWTDGTKTVVKCQSGEAFDPEKGLAMAISKKVLGNDYGYYEIFAKYIGRYNKKKGKKDEKM